MALNLGDKLGDIVCPGAGLLVRLCDGFQHNVLGSVRDRILRDLAFSSQAGLWNGFYQPLHDDLQRNRRRNEIKPR